MANNLLTEIPADLAKLADAGLLRSLDCSENRITTLADELADIRSMESIKLAHNLLTVVPNCIPRLFNLSELDLSYNQLQEIPPSLCGLVFLEKLNVSYNQLTALPKDLSAVAALKELNACHNQITELPPAVEKWKRLVTLRMDHNQLATIPDELGFLLTLDVLTIEENPFGERPEIIERGLFVREKLIKFLRENLRKSEHKRMLLFTEKDNNRNTRFEVMEGDDKPTLTGATPEKLALFLTQVGLPGEWGLRGTSLSDGEKRHHDFGVCREVLLLL